MPPGTYTAVLKVDDQEARTEIRVNADPRLEMTSEDYRIQGETTDELMSLLSAAHGMINEVDALKVQLDLLQKRYEDDENEAVSTSIQQLLKDLKTQKAELTRPPPSMSYRQKPRLREEILSVMRAVNNVPARPTEAQQDRVVSLREEASVVRQSLNALIEGPLSELNNTLRDVPAITVKPVIRP